MKRVITILAAALVLGIGGGAQAFFIDDFEDGVIDPNYWTYTGDITESGGFLNLDREDPADWIQTVNGFSGDWILEMDIRLNYIVWNDMFHGLSVRNDVGAWGDGFSFGFTQYGNLYLGLHGNDGNSISYYYGNSNLPGQWRHWKFTNTSGFITVEVDGVVQDWVPGAINMPDGAKVDLPGHYEDGDGGQHQGVTSSDVDYFAINGTTSTLSSSWGEIKAIYR